ncbi:BppU family phage baseplate upper protein [Staphylococcus aureus]|nr:BppU family phage baseplate upper protein [Staphylococcus aureus]
MYKIKDIETRINNKTVDIGDIGCRFYTEDENTAYVRIGINDEKGRINFKESNLTPKLHLFLEDGSIFKNEPVLTDDNVKGFLTYKIPKNVIKHVGMVPYFTKNVNKIKSSLNNTYKPDISGTYRIEKMPEKLQAKSYVLSNDTNDVITAFEFENIIKTNRINDNAIKGDTWIEHRNADMGKIYNQQFKEETIEAGYEWQFKLNYRTTEIPYANTLI